MPFSFLNMEVEDSMKKRADISSFILYSMSRKESARSKTWKRCANK